MNGASTPCIFPIQNGVTLFRPLSFRPSPFRPGPERQNELFFQNDVQAPCNYFSYESNTIVHGKITIVY